jgi:AraC-like DNA-binding protein
MNLLRWYFFVAACFYFLLCLGQLLMRGKKLRNYFLADIYFSVGFVLLANFNNIEDKTYAWRWLVNIDLMAAAYIGPVSYFYAAANLNPGWKFDRRQWLHALIPIVITIACLPLHILNEPNMVHRIARLTTQGALEFPFDYLFVFVFFYGAVYYVLVLQLAVKAFRENRGKSDDALARIGFLLVALGVVQVSAVLAIVLKQPLLFRVSAAIISTTAFVYLILGNRYPELLHGLLPELTKPRYQSSVIGNLDLDSIESRLMDLMVREKIYRDEELTVKTLAVKLEIKAHQLTEFLNDKKNQNFASFVNSYRLTEVCERLVSEKDQTVLRLAYEAGFRTKSAFNSLFKKHTGMSPQAYRASKAS